VKFNTLT